MIMKMTLLIRTRKRQLDFPEHIIKNVVLEILNATEHAKNKRSKWKQRTTYQAYSSMTEHK